MFNYKRRTEISHLKSKVSIHFVHFCSPLIYSNASPINRDGTIKNHTTVIVTTADNFCWAIIILIILIVPIIPIILNPHTNDFSISWNNLNLRGKSKVRLSPSCKHGQLCSGVVFLNHFFLFQLAFHQIVVYLWIVAIVVRAVMGTVVAMVTMVAMMMVTVMVIGLKREDTH